MDIEARNRIEKYFIRNDYRIIDFIIRGDQRMKIYEIYVDSRNNVLIDDLGRFNKELWELLESKELTKGLSKIIISSPGVERSFKYIWQMYKHVGRILEVKLKNGKTLVGKLEEVFENENPGIKLFVTKKGKNDTENSINEIIFSDIAESKVKIRF
jgi:ribosome maturation factor RimP